MTSVIEETLTVAKEVPFDKDGPLFNISPLPTRRTLGTEERFQKFKESDKCSKPLYPNYDGSIWTRPNENEVLAPQSGVVIGTIPQWLNGTLIRNGTGLTKVGKDEYKHVFDCPALISKFTIKSGVVTYQNRFLDTKVYKKNQAEQRIVVSEFGTKSVPDPCRTFFQRLTSFFTQQTSDNTMVSIYPFGDEIYALGDIPLIHELDIEALNIKKTKPLAKSYSIVHHTSHPHVDTDGTVYNLGMTGTFTGTYHQIMKFPINNEGKPMFDKVQIVASMPARWSVNPSYMHSFGMTQNYFIIIEQPCTIYVPTVALKIFGEPITSCFRWYETEYTRICVISRETGKVCKTFYADPFFYVHTINHYEDGNNVILDINIYRDPSVFETMFFDALNTMQNNPEFENMLLTRPVRFVLPMEPKSDQQENLVELKNTTAKAFYLPDGNIMVKPEKLSDTSCELPRFNYDYMGKKYKYCYGICFDVGSEYAGNVIKIDIENKITKAWGEKGCFPSEPIFVPRPGGQDEDDGVVLTSMVYSGNNSHRISLVVIDGKTFNELGRVEIKTPGEMRQGFHGWFLNDKKQ